MKITINVPVEIEVPDGTPVDAVKITSSSGFMAGLASPVQPDTNKQFGDSNEAYANAVAANTANFSLRFCVITSGDSYRVWPINPQGGWEIPAGWRHFRTPIEQPAPAPQQFPPHDERIHDIDPNEPIDPSRTGGR